MKKVAKIVSLFAIILGVVFMTGCSESPNPQVTPESNNSNPQVTIEMENGGKIVLELYPNKAPNTVNNFLSLASSGYYDDLIFHRVISNFMIQGGCPEGTGGGNPGYLIEGEMANNDNDKNDLSHVRGIISMARRGPEFAWEDPKPYYNTAGSQFFIVVEDSEFLDDEYTAFGKVIEGMDVVDEIRFTRTDRNDRPRNEQKIKQMTVETFGVEYNKPETIK